MHPERSFEHGRVTIMDAQRWSRRIGLLCLAITAVGWGLNWPVIKRAPAER